MYSYLQYIQSTLCTVTCCIWTVHYIQLPAVCGLYIMYSYRQYLDSTFVELPAVYGHDIMYSYRHYLDST